MSCFRYQELFESSKILESCSPKISQSPVMNEGNQASSFVNYPSSISTPSSTTIPSRGHTPSIIFFTQDKETGSILNDDSEKEYSESSSRDDMFYGQNQSQEAIFECCSQSFHECSLIGPSSQFEGIDSFLCDHRRNTTSLDHRSGRSSLDRMSAPPVSSVSPFLLQDEVLDRFERQKRWEEVVFKRRKRRTSDQPLIYRSCASVIVQPGSDSLIFSSDSSCHPTGPVLHHGFGGESLCDRKTSKNTRSQSKSQSKTGSKRSATLINFKPLSFPNKAPLVESIIQTIPPPHFDCGFIPISPDRKNTSTSTQPLIEKAEVSPNSRSKRTKTANKRSKQKVNRKRVSTVTVEVDSECINTDIESGPARPFVSTQGDHFLPSFLSLTAKLPPILSAEEGADLAADERRLADVKLQEKVSGITKGRRSSYSLCYDLSTSFSQTNTVPAQYVPQTSINGLSDISFSAAPVLSQSQMTDSFFDIETGIADHSGVIPHSSLGTIECPEISETHLGPGETSELYKLDLCEMCSIVTSEGLAGEIVKEQDGVSFVIDPFANSGFLV
ncbi:hypothetical protein ADUPG1_008672 [Aduncisulcus paluster]|uniref:Uncharacterized protein n=1 Tax=Aduncisulcus paluster TaxID=2918883 RepID=A0ABQ5KST0_9EUKA|nr:hypothetical protein ADUPG1_008672 [Aduncisulcus paluster]